MRRFSPLTSRSDPKPDKTALQILPLMPTPLVKASINSRWHMSPDEIYPVESAGASAWSNLALMLVFVLRGTRHHVAPWPCTLRPSCITCVDKSMAMAYMTMAYMAMAYFLDATRSCGLVSIGNCLIVWGESAHKYYLSTHDSRYHRRVSKSIGSS